MASVHVKSCKIEKIAHITHFEQKNTHISGCKIMYLCTITTVTMHIYPKIMHNCYNNSYITKKFFFFLFFLFFFEGVTKKLVRVSLQDNDRFIYTAYVNCTHSYTHYSNVANFCHMEGKVYNSYKL